MLTKLIDKASDATTLSMVYGWFGSICGLLVVADSLFGIHTGNGPLGAAQAIGKPLRIPMKWAGTTSEYIAHHTILFSTAAFLMGVLALLLVGHGDIEEDLPTRPASTFWICLAIATQCRNYGGWAFSVWSLVGAVVMLTTPGQGGVRDLRENWELLSHKIIDLGAALFSILTVALIPLGAKIRVV